MQARYTWHNNPKIMTTNLPISQFINSYRLLLLLLVSLFSHNAFATLTASIDREYAYEGETVTLTISAESRANLQDPDFSPLQKNFEIGGTSESTSISIFNGRRSDRHSWSVRLMPKSSGILEIPSIQVGNESTLPLKVDIRPIPVQTGDSGAEPVFLKMEIDSKARRFYVQQQIPVVVRLYYRHEISEGQITDPTPENALLERIGDDHSYSETRNGQQYRVYERRYSLFAEKSGELPLPAASFRGYLKKQGSAAKRNPHDFFSQFSAPLLMSQGQPVSLRSENLSLMIEPHPPGFSGQQWLPAEDLELKDSWTDNPPVFRVGQPVSRTLTITAKGLVASQLQSLELPAISSFRRYAEPAETTTKTDGKQVYATSRQTFTYIPAYAGEQEIPEIDLPWWNVLSDSEERAVLPAWKVLVEADPNQTSSPAPVTTARPPAANTTIPAVQAPAENPANADAVDNNSAQAGWLGRLTDVLSGRLNTFDRNQVITLSIILLIGLLVVIALRRSMKPRPENLPASPAANPAAKTHGVASGSGETMSHSRAQLISDLEKQLKRACLDNDARNSCRILMDMGRLLWPENPATSLGALAGRLDEAESSIRELDRHLYAGGPLHWNGARLLADMQKALHRSAPDKPVEEALKPLYPSS
jgi:hypothetical protein